MNLITMLAVLAGAVMVTSLAFWSRRRRPRDAALPSALLPSGEPTDKVIAGPQLAAEVVTDPLQAVTGLPVDAVADVPGTDFLNVTGNDILETRSSVVPSGAGEETVSSSVGDDVQLASLPLVEKGSNEGLTDETRRDTVEEKPSTPVLGALTDAAVSIGDSEDGQHDADKAADVVLSVPTDILDTNTTVDRDGPAEQSSLRTEATDAIAEFTDAPLDVAEARLSAVEDKESGSFAPTKPTEPYIDVPLNGAPACTAASEAGGNQSGLADVFCDPSDSVEHSIEVTAGSSQSLDEPGSVVAVDVQTRSRQRRNRPAVYRDRRGGRRVVPGERMAEAAPGRGIASPAEAWLRLALHPIQRTVTLALVLARPEGFPANVTLVATGASLLAYDARRYDDVDIPAGTILVGGELRFDSVEGFQWLRTARRIQLFSTSPTEPDWVSVSAARAGAEHAVLCRTADVPEVRRIAALAGSPALMSHDGWPGVPAGCAVLSEYRPVRTVRDVDPSLRTLDPGESVEIELFGGLAIRPKAFAQGYPPSIIIGSLPEGTTVTIGGERAQQSESGSWVAPGWDAPGRHTIDVVPGPSVTYEILADPAYAAGWSFWNAHPDRFGVGVSAILPWQNAQICGARLIAPDGRQIVAAQAQESSVALGLSSTAAILRRRADAPVSVGAISGDIAFLVSTSGPRRQQGRVIWMGHHALTLAVESRSTIKLWIDTIRTASARRLSLVAADDAGTKSWRNAVVRARTCARQNK